MDVAAAVATVAPVCEQVRTRGAAAVRELTRRLDGVDLATTRVPQQRLDGALASLDPGVREALQEAARRARLVHEAQVPAETTTRLGEGAAVTERYLPVGRAGVYVPGGLVAYPSSVLMNVIPAQVAGVGEIAVASPPRPENGGLPHPAVLAACALLGVTEVHAAGGAQAIAMLGYGTEDCAAADTVTGPGNVYVAAAKRLLSGRVATDAEAGPTEIAVIADHTTDPGLADAVDRELAVQAPAARHAERVGQALSGQSACVLVASLEAALAVADAWAPEHLEIQTADPAALARRVRNAGAVFAGRYAPVSLGDYLAGSNHVLPTGGTARHTGGLSVLTFLRVIHLVEYDKAALARVAPHIEALGGAEDLAAHVAAVRLRVGTSGTGGAEYGGAGSGGLGKRPAAPGA